MPLSAVNTQIKNFVLQQFPLARTKNISEADPLLESGILDSLGILEVVTFLENAFHMTLSDEELVPENFHSIESIAAFVQQKCHDL